MTPPPQWVSTWVVAELEAAGWEWPPDGAVEEVDGEVFRFSQAHAAHAVNFIQHGCRHMAGKFAGEYLELVRWQRWWVGTLFGWLREDGRRRFYKALLFIARKNGKSTLAAAIALYLLMADGEVAAEVYSAAADTQQAAIVHRVAESMAKAEPRLAERLRFRLRNIFYDHTAGFYRVLSADAYTKHGLNPHGVIFDELHTQPSRDLWDVLDSATGARLQPLFLAITTAGVLDRHSIVWEQYEYAAKVRDGIISDPSYLPLLFEAPPDSDWMDPDTWRMANPNMGVAIEQDYLERQARYAAQIPAAENTFRRLHLNQWTEQTVRWIPVEKWREECLGVVNAEGLAGQVCYAGLDLASTRDITALVLVFPREAGEGPWPILARFWCPEETVRERAARDKVPYDVWARQGWIRTTPGNVTDYEFIRAEIQQIAEDYQLQGLAIDRWNATQLAVQLGNDGIPVQLMGQGFASMNAPSQEFERRVVSGQLIHDENEPVLSWMISNVQRKEDPAGNIKPDKSASGEKIDGVVALIMALGQAMKGEGPQISVYETGGLTVI